MDAKRRLPVLQAPANEDVPERPAWQWAVFGAGLIVLLWVVLALLFAPWTQRLPGTGPLSTLVQAGIQALASFLVGMVVGTWSRRRGIREGALAGALSAWFAAVCGVAVALSVGGANGADVAVSFAGGAVLLPSATVAGAVGAWIGGRKKRVLEASG